MSFYNQRTAIDKDMAVIQEDGSAEYVETEEEKEEDVVADQEMHEVPPAVQSSETASKTEQGETSGIEAEFFNN